MSLTFVKNFDIIIYYKTLTVTYSRALAVAYKQQTLASVYTDMNNKLSSIKSECVCNYKINVLQIENIKSEWVKIRIWGNKGEKRTSRREIQKKVIKSSRNAIWCWKQICELRDAKGKKCLCEALLECHH